MPFTLSSPSTSPPALCSPCRWAIEEIQDTFPENIQGSQVKPVQTAIRTEQNQQVLSAPQNQQGERLRFPQEGDDLFLSQVIE